MRYVVLFLCTMLLGCSSTTVELSLESPDFSYGRRIPEVFTCDSENISPSFHISGVPSHTQSLAFVMEDPDAPSGVFDHWVLYSIPPQTRILEQGRIPDGSLAGVTTSGKEGYAGPCPPTGVHRYFFTVYALDTSIGFSEPPTKEQLLALIDGNIIATAQYMGTYSR